MLKKRELSGRERSAFIVLERICMDCICSGQYFNDKRARALARGLYLGGDDPAPGAG